MLIISYDDDPIIRWFYTMYPEKLHDIAVKRLFRFLACWILI